MYIQIRIKRTNEYTIQNLVQLPQDVIILYRIFHLNLAD